MTKDHSWSTDTQTKPRLSRKKMKKDVTWKINKNKNYTNKNLILNEIIIQDPKDDIQIKSKIVQSIVEVKIYWYRKQCW